MTKADLEPKAAESAAIEVLSRRFGRVDSLSSADGGLTNHVFHATAGGEALIARVGPVEKAETFRREVEVIAYAREAGVPAPDALFVSEADACSVMVSRALPGEIARDHPERLRTLHDLGALAASRIHAIRTTRAGCDFDFGAGRTGDSWRAWLIRDFKAEERLETLEVHDLISRQQSDSLRATLDRVVAWSDDPILNHGDLRLKNVLVGEDGAILGLIDWESNLACPGPHWDLSVALHDLWVDQAQAFLKGYGLETDAVLAAAPVWRLFNSLNYGPEVKRVVKAQDWETLEQIRLRFSGALDLFGLG